VAWAIDSQETTARAHRQAWLAGEGLSPRMEMDPSAISMPLSFGAWDYYIQMPWDLSF
jgi:hypothetical protein